LLTKDNIQSIYSLSPMQQSMLIHHAVDSESSAYIEQFDFCIAGRLDPVSMERALAQLVERHDALRTIFSYRKTDLPRQVVLTRRMPALDLRDWRDVPDTETALEAFKAEDRRRGFDLTRDLLLRAALLRIGEAQWRLIVTFHHIVLDGWSIGLLLQDLVALYEAAAGGREVADTERPPSFDSYIRWLEGRDRAAAASYWRQQLEGYEQPASLPAFGPAAPYSHARHSFCLPPSLSEALRQLAAARRWTLSTVMHAVWGVLLMKYNGTRDVVFGSVVSGRPPQVPDVESMVGLFINTQPVRVRAEAADSFAELCSKVQQASLEAAAYEFFPLFEAQGASSLKNRLLDHVVAFENYPLSERLRDLSAQPDQALRFEEVQVYEQTGYDFNLVINPGDECRMTFLYNSNRYELSLMEGLEQSLLTLMTAVCAEPEAAVVSLGICAPQERQRILRQFNGNRCAYPDNRTVHGLFSEMAARYADKPALRWQDESMTYRELDGWSDTLATRMRKAGIGLGDTVALLAPRCPEMVAGLLAILKTGATYVPLDLANARERLAFIVEDAGIRFGCTLTALAAELPPGLLPIRLDEPADAAELADLTASGETSSGPGDPRRPACMMYTSGSTGQPKGCLISHRSIISLLHGPDYIDFGPQQVILPTCSPSFDASFFELFGALLHGGTIILAEPRALLDPDSLRATIARYGVSSMLLTTALFNVLCDRDPSLFGPLRELLIGGEAASPRHLRQARKANPELRIVNCYGPTENTTISTFHLVTEADEQLERVPIGRPLVNSTAYILDEALHLLPIGAIGELCVGGDGVSLGYYRRPELTAEKFVEDPFARGAKLYRTGDLARWLPDGSLDYIGRVDAMVKVRGYRIELGAIERAMSRLPGVEEATVQVRIVGQEKQLCAYYTSMREPDVSQWRFELSKQIPEYMLPAFFTRLDALPLTVNGKIDTAALPSPTATRPERKLLPPSETERRIGEIVSAVIGVEGVGTQEQFFEIGVNSLNMITIHNRIKTAFDTDFPLTVMFQHTSIAELARYIQIPQDDSSLASDEEELVHARNTLLRTSLLIQRMEETH